MTEKNAQNIDNTSSVTRAEPRDTAQITIADMDVTLSAPIGTPLESYFREAFPDEMPKARLAWSLQRIGLLPGWWMGGCGN